MPRKQRLKDDDEDEEDDELPSGLLPSSRIAHKARKQRLKDEETENYLKEVRSDILNALKTAEKVPVNPISDIVEDVYSEVPWHLKAQREALLEHIKRYPDKYPKTSGEVGK